MVGPLTLFSYLLQTLLSQDFFDPFMANNFTFNGTVDEAMKIKSAWESSVTIHEGQIDQLYSRLAAIDKFLDSNTVQIIM